MALDLKGTPVWKGLLGGIFALGIPVLLYFISTSGINYIEAHGKFFPGVLFAVSSAIGAGLITNFRDFFRPPYVKKTGEINPTYGIWAFSIVIVVLWNLLLS